MYLEWRVVLGADDERKEEERRITDNRLRG